MVEAWDASSGGWPGMRAGPEIESINHTFTNGVQIMANIESPNKELRKSVRAAIDVHLRSAK